MDDMNGEAENLKPAKANKKVTGRAKAGPSLFRPRDLETVVFSIDVSKIFHGILRHIPLVLLCAVAFAFLGGYISHRLSNMYYSQAILIYQKDSPGYRGIEFQLFKLSMPAAIEMITLPVHLKAVKSLLGIDLSVEELAKMISVEPPLKESNLITITVKASQPALAVSIANTLVQVVAENSRQFNEKQWQEAYNFFKKEEQELQVQIAAQNQEILNFRKSHGYAYADVQTVSPGQNLTHNEQQLQTADLEYIRIRSEHDAISEEYAKIPDKVEAPSEDEQLLRQRISKLEESIMGAQVKYATENPKLKGLELQLTKLRNQLKVLHEEDSKEKNWVVNPKKENLHLQLISLGARLDAAKKFKEEMNGVVGKMREGIGKLSLGQSQLIALTTKKNMFELELTNVIDRQRAIRVIQNLGKSDLEVYEESSKAFGKTIPFMVILLPSIGFIVGALFGMGIASTMELLDRKYRTPKELDNIFTVPTLATIPQRRVFKKYGADDEMIYYMRSISERLNRLPVFPHVINITSSTRREGKTTIANYLARYYSKVGKKTIVLCLDSCADSMHNAEEMPPELLETYLKGKASFEDIIFHGPPDKIICRNDPAMQELLTTEAFKKMMLALRKSYDLIIIDAPGVIEEVYAINLTDLADATLFVIGSSTVSRKHVNSALKRMEEYGAKVDGFILNKVLAVYIDDVYFKAQMSKTNRWTLLGR